MNDKITVGWQEWCVLPDLKIAAIKAKVDTGACTSSLHAFNIEPYHANHKKYVSFCIHPLQNDNKFQVSCRALVVDEREVLSSSGHKEHRYVIETALKLGDYTWNIEVTLSNRDPMRFRMLLGREALAGQVIVDPSYIRCQDTLQGRKASSLYKTK